MSISDHARLRGAPAGHGLHGVTSALLLWLAAGGWACVLPASSSPPAAGGMFAAGGGEKARSVAAVAPPETGAELYRALCASCHGQDGRGETPLARELDPAPPDLTRCNFKLRSTPTGSLPTDEDLLRTLYVGLPGSAMPSFAGLLPLPPLRALALQVKARCARFSSEALARPLPRTTAPCYEEGSIRRGEAAFRAQGCSGCHGADGEGDGPAAASLRDNQGRPLRPRDYTRGVFRSGFARQDLYRALSTGLDGTPMPALAEETPAAVRWDLVHYVVSRSDLRSRVVRALERAPTWYEPVSTWGLPCR